MLLENTAGNFQNFPKSVCLYTDIKVQLKLNIPPSFGQKAQRPSDISEKLVLALSLFKEAVGFDWRKQWAYKDTINRLLLGDVLLKKTLLFVMQSE